jgi:hypothetical protein
LAKIYGNPGHHKKMENNKNEITQFIEGVVPAKSAKTT